MTDLEPPAWWPTTWGALLAGDDVQAPDGSAWMVASSILSDGAGEWLIVREADDCRVWTPHHVDEQVTARRYPFSGSGAILEALGRVFPLYADALASDVRKPGARRWVLCGREVCTCRW